MTSRSRRSGVRHRGVVQQFAFGKNVAGKPDDALPPDVRGGQQTFDHGRLTRLPRAVENQDLAAAQRFCQTGFQIAFDVHVLPPMPVTLPQTFCGFNRKLSEKYADRSAGQFKSPPYNARLVEKGGKPSFLGKPDGGAARGLFARGGPVAAFLSALGRRRVHGARYGLLARSGGRPMPGKFRSPALSAANSASTALA